jgi:tyrosyl-tRNA synthetase
MTSPYKFHQFWLNVPDADAIRMLKVFTFEARETIEEVERASAAKPEDRLAQKLLADSVCTLVHGAQSTEDAKRAAEALFKGSLEGLSPELIQDIFADAPSSVITNEQVHELDILTLLSSTVSKSKGEARRLIQSGGIYLDNQRITDEKLTVLQTNLQANGFIVLRSGKKNYHIVRVA